MYILTTSYLHSFCVPLRRIGQLKRINVEHAKSSMLENKKNAKCNIIHWNLLQTQSRLKNEKG